MQTQYDSIQNAIKHSIQIQYTNQYTIQYIQLIHQYEFTNNSIQIQNPLQTQCTYNVQQKQQKKQQTNKQHLSETNKNIKITDKQTH